jgi:hypothetical protein
MAEGGYPMDGTWMTKAEIAAVRRTSIASADRFIRRQGWRRQPGNDGKVRVLVPPAGLEPSKFHHPTDSSTSGPTVSKPAALRPPDRTAAYEAAVEAWRGRAELAEGRVAAAEGRADRAEQRADRAEAELSALRQDQARRGVLARLRAAWRRK